MQLCNNQGQWCNRPTDQSDSRGKKRAGTLPGIPVSIKGADLHLHLISDLFSRRQRISLQGLSVSATVSYGHTVSPLFLAFSLFLSLLLSFKDSFIYISLSLQVSSSWFFFLYQQQTLWLISPSPLLPFFSDLILQFLSCLKGHGGS